MSYEFKGTKGTWEVRSGTIYTAIYHGDLQLAIKVSAKKEMRTNILLMSKAPEMLEMLKGILSDIHSGNYPSGEWKVDEIEQLIKEATKI